MRTVVRSFDGADAAPPEDAPERCLVRPAIEMAIGVEDGARRSCERREAVQLKWLSMMMRSATRRVTAFQISHSVADQISPLSCSSAFGPWSNSTPS